MFSVALSVERSRPNRRGGPPGRYPAHCSAEFGLSSPRIRRRRKRPSGPAAYCFIICDGEERTSDLGPRTSDLRPRTSDFGPQTSDFGPRTFDCLAVCLDSLLDLSRLIQA